MSKSRPTPKELLIRRIRNNKLLRVTPLECDHKVRQPLKTFKNKKIEPPLRDISSKSFPNPFAIPIMTRLFSKISAPRKIHPEPSTTENVHTVCDIHNEFYRVIEGRPLRQADDIKVYMSNIRDICLCRTDIGYRKEEIVRIDADYRTEVAEYEKARELYLKYSASFVSMLKFSFIQAKKVQDEAAKIVVRIEKVNDELEEYNFEYSKLKNELVVLSAKYEILLTYSDFLTSMTPDWLQQQGMNIHRDTRIHAKLSSTIELGPKVVIKSALSLPCDEPTLVFKNPKQLITIFDNICRQGHLYMDVGNYTKQVLNNVLREKDEFKSALKAAAGEMETEVNIFRNRNTYLEDKANSYKSAFHKLLNNDFQRLYGDFDNIKLHTCVQYVHTRVFGGIEDPKDNVTTMMDNIEGFYMNLSLALDGLDVKAVNTAAKEMFAKDIKMMSLAYKAQRELYECDILSKTLFHSFEPPRWNKKKK
ncbi:uncharacterized protein LOC142975242 [Anticarsia gemmatalis]|uniref:uncharacterized protein LOC142975242 n=1 Tax=Anticarsia gemmatalis TaxID=129554 RepID=UPI003F7609F1